MKSDYRIMQSLNKLAGVFGFTYFVKGILLCMLIFVNNSCQKIKHDKDSTVYIAKTEKGYQIYRNGEMFNMQGSSGKSFFTDLSAAGANTIRVYDTTNLKSSLDQIHEAGLAAVVNIPIPRLTINDTVYSKEVKTAKLQQNIKNFVRKHMKHPALLFWILGNEVNYPDLPGDNDFVEAFNQMLAIVHAEDVKRIPIAFKNPGFL